MNISKYNSFYYQGSASSLLTGLYAAYNYENNVLDLSGNGRNATVVNAPTYSAGKFGQAINLNGVNQYVFTSPNSDFLFGSGDFTVSIWVKKTAPLTTNYIIVKGNGSGSSGDAFAAYFGSGKLNYYLNTNVANYFKVSTFTLDSNYHNVIITREGNFFRAYYDGVFDSEIAVSGTMNTVNQPYNHGFNSFQYTGQFDCHCVWNRALTALEKTALQTAQYPF
jgi:hypothetical protein